MKNLINEIHRRSLWQVLGIYLAGSWIALQVVEQLAEAASLPEWVRPLALILLVIGLPVVLATAFVQEGMATREAESPQQSLADLGEVPPAPPVAASGAAALFTWKNAVMGGIGALTVWGLVALVWVIRGGGQATALDDPMPGGASPLQARVAAIAARADADLPTVAVLPFTDQGSEDEFAYFADGVHEDLLTNLAKVNGLIVLARPTVIAYRDSDLSTSEIAAELGASAVVTGSVRRAGTSVRITVELTDPVSNASLWAERYDRELEDMFAVQSEISLAVANGLRAELSATERARLEQAPTDDMTAFDLYTRGRQAYYEYEADANERAIEMFRAAVDKDPAYGQAWAGLADALGQNVMRYGATLNWADSAVQAAARAVELVSESSEAHKAHGLALYLRGLVEESIAANERALEYNPNNADAANNLAILYSEMGRHAEAIPLYKLSERLRPHVYARTNMAQIYAWLGLSSRAEEVLDADQAYSGETGNNLDIRALLALFDGDYEAMTRYNLRVIEVASADAEARPHAAARATWARDWAQAESLATDALSSGVEGQSYLKNAFTTLGQAALERGESTQGSEYLRRSLAQLETKLDGGDRSVWTRYQLAVVHASLGEDDVALRRLGEALDLGAIMPQLLELEPGFDGVRQNPEFQSIVTESRRRADAERRKIAESEGILLPPGS